MVFLNFLESDFFMFISQNPMKMVFLVGMLVIYID